MSPEGRRLANVVEHGGCPMVPMPFAMSAGEREGVLVVQLAGRLESPWADEVRHTLTRHSPSALWLDLSLLTRVDDRGLAALVELRQDVVSGGGRFLLHSASGNVRAALAAAGLDALVDDERDSGADLAALPAARARRRIGPVTQLPTKGGQDARRPTRAPKVA